MVDKVARHQVNNLRDHRIRICASTRWLWGVSCFQSAAGISLWRAPSTSSREAHFVLISVAVSVKPS
jgi:hypothetical protein